MQSYPYIFVDYDNKYISKNESIEVDVYLYIGPDNRINITNLCNIYSLDDKIIIDGNTLTAFKEGINKIFFTYTYNSKKYFEEIEFIIYDTFFRDNYKLHFIPEIDKINIQSNEPLEIFFDVLFEFIDIIYVYVNEVDNIKHPLKTKYDYLRSLFTEKGFNFFDFETEFDSLDEITFKIYRNLLFNMERILEIRGTESAYELFFTILGYDIEIFEYWFNSEGNLVEFNLTYPENSTFKCYDTNGRELPEYDTYEDPRYFLNNTQNKTVNNKSNFIKILYRKNQNLPYTFTKSRFLIKKYLECLRPKHIRYFEDIYDIAIFDEGIDGEEINLNFIGFDGDDTTPSGLNAFRFTSYIDTYYPPYVKKFRSEEGSINFSGYSETSALIYYFNSSSGKIKFENGALIYLTEYSFESTSGKMEFKGSYNERNFTSESGKLEFKNGATFSAYVYKYLDFNSKPTILWSDYMTQENIDNFEMGFVNGFYTNWLQHYSSETFSRNFSLEDTSTYQTELDLTPGFSFRDEIVTKLKFDIDWDFDDGIMFDSFQFMLEKSFYDTNNDDETVNIMSINQNEINNKYYALALVNSIDVVNEDTDNTQLVEINDFDEETYVDYNVIIYDLTDSNYEVKYRWNYDDEIYEEFVDETEEEFELRLRQMIVTDIKNTYNFNIYLSTLDKFLN